MFTAKFSIRTYYAILNFVDTEVTTKCTGVASPMPSLQNKYYKNHLLLLPSKFVHTLF